jgi:site-specific DNA-cytosine methylase
MKPISLQDTTTREKAQNGKGWSEDGTSYTLDAAATQGVAIPINGMTLNKELRDKQMTGVGQEGDPMFSVRADGAQHTVGFNWQNGSGYGEANDGLGITLEGVGPLQRCQTPAVANGGGMAVRRLTPKECERLQGFPDNHTLIPWRGKPAEQCPDGPRYKALGNSMAVPCMAWIGKRIAAQDSEPLRYLSVCSGIEAASMAWEPLGWQPAAFAEVEKFPSAVLTHHWPQVPNMGDMNNHEQWDLPAIDVLVGGTPCQSFSVAGLRKGLRDPRGGLMLTFLEIAQRRRPRWIVWENVPGVLSSHGGRDFGAFLGALGALGYGWAYRVLDAQWFGVAQRRRRVFVVANLGDGAAPAKVLFESESVRRNPAPSRETGERTAAFTPSSIGSYRAGYGTLRANGGDNGGGERSVSRCRNRGRTNRRRTPGGGA